jgi:HPt (histidine-containing phosphotransfer) domain-containing protein
MPVQQSQERIKDYLKHQFNLPSEQIDTMIPDFMSSLADHLAHLESMLHHGDARQLGKAGHTIKGALLNLGLHDCAEIAHSIEKKGKRDEQGADYADLVASLREKLSSYLN